MTEKIRGGSFSKRGRHDTFRINSFRRLRQTGRSGEGRRKGRNRLDSSGCNGWIFCSRHHHRMEKIARHPSLCDRRYFDISQALTTIKEGSHTPSLEKFFYRQPLYDDGKDHHHVCNKYNDAPLRAMWDGQRQGHGNSAAKPAPG